MHHKRPALLDVTLQAGKYLVVPTTSGSIPAPKKEAKSVAGGLTLDPDGGLTSAGQRALERIFFSLDLDMKDAGRLTLADLKAPLDAKAFGHARVQRFVDACGIDVGGGGEVPLPPEGLTFLQLQEALRKADAIMRGE